MNVYDVINDIRKLIPEAKIVWDWEKISKGNECQTIYIYYKGINKKYQGFKYKDIKNLLFDINMDFNSLFNESN